MMRQSVNTLSHILSFLPCSDRRLARVAHVWKAGLCSWNAQPGIQLRCERRAVRDGFEAAVQKGQVNPVSLALAEFVSNERNCCLLDSVLQRCSKLRVLKLSMHTPCNKQSYCHCEGCRGKEHLLLALLRRSQEEKSVMQYPARLERLELSEQHRPDFKLEEFSGLSMLSALDLELRRPLQDALLTPREQKLLTDGFSGLASLQRFSLSSGSIFEEQVELMLLSMPLLTHLKLPRISRCGPSQLQYADSGLPRAPSQTRHMRWETQEFRDSLLWRLSLWGVALRSLHMRANVHGSRRADGWRVLHEHLPSLERLCIERYEFSQWDMNDLVGWEVPQAWPHLESLQLVRVVNAGYRNFHFVDLRQMARLKELRMFGEGACDYKLLLTPEQSAVFHNVYADAMYPLATTEIRTVPGQGLSLLAISPVLVA